MATEFCPNQKEAVYLNKTETGVTYDTPYILPNNVQSIVTLDLILLLISIYPVIKMEIKTAILIMEKKIPQITRNHRIIGNGNENGNQNGNVEDPNNSDGQNQNEDLNNFWSWFNP